MKSKQKMSIKTSGKAILDLTTVIMQRIVHFTKASIEKPVRLF